MEINCEELHTMEQIFLLSKYGEHKQHYVDMYNTFITAYNSGEKGTSIKNWIQVNSKKLKSFLNPICVVLKEHLFSDNHVETSSIHLEVMLRTCLLVTGMEEGKMYQDVEKEFSISIKDRLTEHIENPQAPFVWILFLFSYFARFWDEEGYVNFFLTYSSKLEKYVVKQEERDKLPFFLRLYYGPMELSSTFATTRGEAVLFSNTGGIMELSLTGSMQHFGKELKSMLNTVSPKINELFGDILYLYSFFIGSVYILCSSAFFYPLEQREDLLDKIFLPDVKSFKSLPVFFMNNKPEILMENMVTLVSEKQVLKILLDFDKKKSINIIEENDFKNSKNDKKYNELIELFQHLETVKDTVLNKLVEDENLKHSFEHIPRKKEKDPKRIVLSVKQMIRQLTFISQRYADITRSLKNGTSGVADKLSMTHPELEEIGELQALSLIPEPASNPFSGLLDKILMPQRPELYKTLESGKSLLSMNVRNMIEHGFSLRALRKEEVDSYFSGLPMNKYSNYLQELYIIDNCPVERPLVVFKTRIHAGGKVYPAFKFAFEVFEHEVEEYRTWAWTVAFRMMNNLKLIPKNIFFDAAHSETQKVRKIAKELSLLLGVTDINLIDPMDWYFKLLELKPGVVLSTKQTSDYDIDRLKKIKDGLFHIFERRMTEQFGSMEVFYRSLFQTDKSFKDIFANKLRHGDLPGKMREVLNQEKVNDIVKLTALKFLHEMTEKAIGILPGNVIFYNLPIFDLGIYNAVSLFGNTNLEGESLIIECPGKSTVPEAFTPVKLWKNLVKMKKRRIILQPISSLKVIEELVITIFFELFAR